MDYSKFALELTSPDYIDYFYNLPQTKKKTVLSTQENLFKGINADLIGDIYNELYIHLINKTNTRFRIFPNRSLENIRIQDDQSIQLSFRHNITRDESTNTTDACILATGYKYIIPEFINPIHHLINWDHEGHYNMNENYSVDRHQTVFTQNADLHSHGFNSADLGLGPYRNATILNAILKKEKFKMETSTTFQQFK
jgi:lysine N6-hydroxylase